VLCGSTSWLPWRSNKAADAQPQPLVALPRRCARFRRRRRSVLPSPLVVCTGRPVRRDRALARCSLGGVTSRLGAHLLCYVCATSAVTPLCYSAPSTSRLPWRSNKAAGSQSRRRSCAGRWQRRYAVPSQAAVSPSRVCFRIVEARSARRCTARRLASAPAVRDAEWAGAWRCAGAR
jgi:hypothetical protein